MPATAMLSSATTGYSAIGLPSSVTFTTPTRWPAETGATIGSMARNSALILSAVPRGTLMATSPGSEPALSSDRLPFQTLMVRTVWPFSYRRTLS